MKRLLQFFIKRWVVSLIGITALVILIWLGGPYLGIADAKPLSSPFNRLLAIVVVVVLWGANNLRQQIKSSKTNQQMINQLVTPLPEVQQPEPSVEISAEEIQHLKERFDDSLQRLKETSFQGRFGKQYLYELPWYVIIGPPGSGKTTLLENSGLEFPVTEHDAQKKVRGIGGTRNCDWWFTNEAVLLDTAGRYTTQDSYAEADSSAWLGFLDLLRKNRPRRPLNGILLAVSIEDLLNRSEEERSLHATAIRQRIQELYSHLGMRFPVYFLLTKCDLVAGFTEYFDDLGIEQRTQVWGMTFPTEQQNKPNDTAKLFSNEFESLVKQLHSRLLLRLYEERDLSRRGLIHSFPQQFASLKPLFDAFIEKIFRPSRYEENPWLRGIYFTSGTQEGSPIDRAIRNLADSYGLGVQTLPTYQGRPKSYFITRLLRDVIFHESELSGANIRYERQRLWLHRGAYAATLGLTVGIIVAWSASFTRNEVVINTLNNGIEKYNAFTVQLENRPNLKDTLKALDYAEDIAQVYGDTPGKTPWLMGMGLYQGFKLGAAAEEAYLSALQHWLLPYFKMRLESSIRRLYEEPETLRQLLGLYVMLGEPQSFDAKRFRPWVINDWQMSLPDAPKAREKLVNHFDALLTTTFNPQELDTVLLAQAQPIVCEIPLSRQIYARLEQSALSAGIASFSLSQLGRDASRVLVIKKNQKAKIPGFYTFDGYRSIVTKEAPDATRLTIEENKRVCEDKRRELDAADAQALQRDIEDRYFKEYTRQWDAFLASIKLINLRNPSQTVDVLDLLSGRNSPLALLLNAVAEHTILNKPVVEGAIQGALKRFNLSTPTQRQPSDPVERAYQPLHRLLRTEDDQPSPLEDILTQLADLQGYVAEISEASDSNEAAFKAASARMNLGEKDAIRLLRRQAKRLPKPVGDLVKSAATQSWGVILGGARAYVNTLWRATALKECRSSLENRYPLYPQSRQNTTIVDFGLFFGQDGTIDTFVDTYLNPFIDKRRWRLRSVDERSLGLSSAAIRQLRRASTIKSMFFQDGTQQPLIRFSLKPVYLDAEVRRFTLTLNDQRIRYSHGPVKTSQMEWPGPGESGKVLIVFERFGAGRFSIIKDGPWAWFKILDDSTIVRKAADQALVAFQTAGLKARYQLRASSVTNPFTSHELVKFRCPQKL